MREGSGVGGEGEGGREGAGSKTVVERDHENRAEGGRTTRISYARHASTCGVFRPEWRRYPSYAMRSRFATGYTRVLPFRCAITDSAWANVRRLFVGGASLAYF